MIYFNNAATTWPKPKAVYNRVDDFFRNSGSNASRSGGGNINSSEKMIFNVREKIANFFSVSDSSKIVFNSGATESLNTVLKGVLKPKDHVITSKAAHNSILRPLSRLKEEREIEVSYLDLTAEGEIIYEQLSEQIKANTKLIALTHASNVLGTVNDLEKIAAAKKENILLLIDAAQTAGLIDIDLRKLDIDFLVFPGHKSLFGPPGIGGLYVKDFKKLKPLKEGGTGSDSLSVNQPKIMPDYLEAGTINSPGIAGLGAGIDFINSTGIENIHQQKLKLLNYLLSSFIKIKAIKIYGRKNIKKRTAVTAFNIGEKNSNQIAFELKNDYNIELRAGLHCAPLLHKAMGTEEQGMLRLSLGYFNTKEEIDRFLNILENLS